MYFDSIPELLINWSKEDIISKCIIESRLSLESIICDDIDMPITSIGSTLLHVATSNLNYPSATSATSVIELLLEVGANPNSRDNYGRTALTNLLTQSTGTLYDNDELASHLLNLLLKHKADPNVLFTPNFVASAGCNKWTLAHDLQADMHGNSRWPLPWKVIDLLNNVLDFAITDSEGRVPRKTYLQKNVL